MVASRSSCGPIVARTGAEIVIEERGDEVILRLAAEPAETRIEDLGAATGFRGCRCSLREMETVIATAQHR
jgi:hypothetical protein